LISEFVLWGLLGSVVKTVVERDGQIVFPRKVHLADGATALQLGFIGNIIVGTIVAVVVDHSTTVSFFSAISGSYILEKGSSKTRGVVDAIFGRKLGDA